MKIQRQKAEHKPETFSTSLLHGDWAGVVEFCFVTHSKSEMRGICLRACRDGEVATRHVDASEQPSAPGTGERDAIVRGILKH